MTRAASGGQGIRPGSTTAPTGDGRSVPSRRRRGTGAALSARRQRGRLGGASALIAMSILIEGEFASVEITEIPGQRGFGTGPPRCKYRCAGCNGSPKRQYHPIDDVLPCSGPTRCGPGASRVAYRACLCADAHGPRPPLKRPRSLPPLHCRSFQRIDSLPRRRSQGNSGEHLVWKRRARA